MKLTLGIFLVIFSVIIMVATYFPVIKHEIGYDIKQLKGAPSKQIEPLNSDFGIVIDKLDINAKVIKDVDPYDSAIYQKALTKGVAHAKGTALPGEKGNIFIFSHSSESFYNALRYNSIFYLLTKLDMGDKITLYYENKPFVYTVSQKKIVDPKDLSYLQNNTTTPTLTLMTCYPPGTDIKRLIILAN